MRERLAELWLLLTAPGEWSARRYARKSSMELTALHPGRWRPPAAAAPADPPPAEPTTADLPTPGRP